MRERDAAANDAAGVDDGHLATQASDDRQGAGDDAGPSADADPSPGDPDTDPATGPPLWLTQHDPVLPAPTEHDVQAAKAELRRLQAARRAGTGPRMPLGGGPRSLDDSQHDGLAIARHVLALPQVVRATWVAAFVSLPGEPSTPPLLQALRARGVRVMLPVVREDLDLDFREYTGILLPGAMGTREPPPAASPVSIASAEVVLVPAVAVDEQGHRLGRGGGSYDRALRRVSPGATVIALVDDQAFVPSVPVSAHDLSVSVIVTPTRVVRVRPM